MIRLPFHLVEPRPWPLLGSISAFFLTTGTTLWIHSFHPIVAGFGFILLILVMIQWWRDISREGTLQGFHTSLVTNGLRWGMALFILSEVCFFFGFFWAFFHSSLAPTHEIGCVWPPIGISVINPFSVPLLNTAILLSSGVTVTWAHHRLMAGTRNNRLIALTLTIILGIYFTILQAREYLEAPFAIADRVYGTTFFVTTGFHGLHVIIGTLFLAVCLLRTYRNHFSSSHHFGFEAAAWYWHFVDVVWIFLYLCIYWWGS